MTEGEKIDLAEGKIGSVGKYDIEFREKQLVVEVDAGLGASSAGIIVKIDANDVKEAIKKAIPGQYDDAALDFLFKALLGV